MVTCMCSKLSLSSIYTNCLSKFSLNFSNFSLDWQSMFFVLSKYLIVCLFRATCHWFHSRIIGHPSMFIVIKKLGGSCPSTTCDCSSFTFFATALFCFRTTLVCNLILSTIDKFPSSLVSGVGVTTSAN